MIAYDVHEEELAIMATNFSQLNMKIDYSLANTWTPLQTGVSIFTI